MLEGLGMEQQVTEATHDKGHTLNLVITRQEESALVTVFKDSFRLGGQLLARFW